MKKLKLLSLILAVLMLLPLVLTACLGDSPTIPNDSSESSSESESESESEILIICGPDYTPIKEGSVDYSFFDFNLRFDDLNMYWRWPSDAGECPKGTEALVFTTVEDMRDRILNHKLTFREKFILANNGYINRSVISNSITFNIAVGYLKCFAVPIHANKVELSDRILFHGAAYSADLSIDGYGGSVRFYTSFWDLLASVYKDLDEDIQRLFLQMQDSSRFTILTPTHPQNDIERIFGVKYRGEYKYDQQYEGDAPQLYCVLEAVSLPEGVKKEKIFFYEAVDNESEKIKVIYEIYETDESIEEDVPTKVYLTVSYKNSFSLFFETNFNGDVRTWPCCTNFPSVFEFTSPSEKLSHEWLLDFDIELYEGEDTAE